MIRSNRRDAESEIIRLLRMKNAAAALAVEGEAKKLCAVDSGRLRASISHDSDETGAVVGTNVEYAPFVELGTIHQRPQPYLVPGLVNSKGILGQIYGR